MLVVSQATEATLPSLPLTLPRQTKHAAELCALLVNDLYGELPSVQLPAHSHASLYRSWRTAGLTTVANSEY
jgi:hypothetical protein